MRYGFRDNEIKKHINFASNCYKHNKKILAICWGLQVCSTAAGGKVAPGKSGAHIGIASDVEINNEGQKNLIYKNKEKKFTTPAFNFDEVITIPSGAIHLASNKINKIHESPLIMLLSAGFLGIGSIFVGFLFKDVFIGDESLSFWGPPPPHSSPSNNSRF